ncbi:MAG: thioredoxin domain-containing protein [Thermodesulfovibrionales bacterium]|nr:thioredoxin domain-containing protein [Thermodesulfovibrionales bacterium]
MFIRKSYKRFGARKYWINVIVSLIGIGIILLYSICGESCEYLQGGILDIELKYLGLLYMGMLIFFSLRKRDLVLLSLLSFGTGAEIYLLGFQIRNLVYCYYCLAFGAIVLLLFLLNLNMSKKTLMGISLFLGFILFSIFFQGAVTPLYAEDPPKADLPPSFGNGKIKVRLYTDYFCGPCRSLEPRLEEVITGLVKKKVINITFIDTPIHKHTSLYARYFLYILNEKKEFNHALYARAILFEAANNRITDKERLEEFLKEKKIKFKPFNVIPTFGLFDSYLREDKINATPICVISNGEKKRFEGTEDIIKALERLPFSPSSSP